MEIKFYELDAVVASLDKLSKVKGLYIWKDVLFNKINAKRTLTSELELFEKERTELLTEFCDKDEDGKPKIEKGNYTFSDDNQEKAQAALEELVKRTNQKVINVDITQMSLSEFDKIKEHAELAEILEPLVVLNIVNE
jgi:hypothetical protein